MYFKASYFSSKILYKKIKSSLGVKLYIARIYNTYIKYIKIIIYNTYFKKKSTPIQNLTKINNLGSKTKQRFK